MIALFPALALAATEPELRVECFRSLGVAFGGSLAGEDWVSVGGARLRLAGSPFLAMGCRSLGSSVNATLSVESAYWYEHAGPLDVRQAHRVGVTGGLSSRVGPVVAGVYGTIGWFALGGGLAVSLPYGEQGSSVDLRLGLQLVNTPELMSVLTWTPHPVRWGSP